MFEALDSLVHRPGVPVYDAVWETGYKFQYPLMSVLPVDPLIRFFGMDREAFHASLNVASWIAFAVLGALTAVLWARLHGPRDAAFWQVVPPRSLIVLAPAGILGAMVFFPITRGLHLGQIQTTLTVLVGISLLAWCTGNKVVAGIALALCCIVKPQWVIIALWALLRREWRFVIAGVVTAGAAFALSIVVYGVEQVLSYADLLLRLGSSGETFYANQSVNGLLNRLLFNGESLHFSHSELAPDHPVVAAGTAISVVVILLFALLWRVRSSPTTLDLSTAVLSLTIAAPIAWEHHYGVAYAVFAVLMVAQFREGSPGRPVIVFTGIAYVLISQNLFPIVNATHDSGWNILQSYMFFGGIILLALLYVQSARAQSVELPARRISVPAPIGDPAA
nr:glycosyltransferase family 87 protein [Microbacterium ulmi]